MNKRYAPSFLCLVAFLIAELLAPNGLVAQPSSSPREDFWITDGPVNFVYIGGSFTSIGGQTRLRGVAAAELPSGNVTSFNRDPTTTDRSATLAMVTKANLLFAGGYVSPLFLGPQPRLTAFDVRDSTTLWDQNPWTARPGRQINALADSVNLLYVGARSIDGQGLKNLAALNPSSGQTSSWNPAVGEVLSLAVSDETVFAGGQYAGGLAVFSPPGFLRLTAQLAENGSFRLTVGATANETYIIQCSSNLVQWLDLATNSGASFFKDASGPPWPRRFYRAVSSQ